MGALGSASAKPSRPGKTSGTTPGVSTGKRANGRPRDPTSTLGLRRRKLALEVRRLEIGVAVDERSKVDVERRWP